MVLPVILLHAQLNTEKISSVQEIFCSSDKRQSHYPATLSTHPSSVSQ